MKNKEINLKQIIDDNPDLAIIVLKNAINGLLKETESIIYDWRRRNLNPSKADCIAQCNLQVIISQMHSILILSEGFCLVDSKTKLLDINSVVSILRGIYERAFIYKNIYIINTSVNF